MSSGSKGTERCQVPCHSLPCRLHDLASALYIISVLQSEDPASPSPPPLGVLAACSVACVPPGGASPQGPRGGCNMIRVDLVPSRRRSATQPYTTRFMSPGPPQPHHRPPHSQRHIVINYYARNSRYAFLFFFVNWCERKKIYLHHSLFTTFTLLTKNLEKKTHAKIRE